MTSNGPIHALSKKVLLVILDGFGLSPNRFKNAVFDAKKPNIDFLFSNFPTTTIEPGGESVGLPKGVSGNSEVGHMNLGAGRPVRQDLVRINEAISNRTLESMPELKNLIKYALTHTRRIHLMGLLSDGGVHSHIDHIKTLIAILAQHKDLEIFFHALMDGRDTASDSGGKYIKELLQQPGFTFASMQGRSIGMDRDRRWEKIKLSYDTIIGQGNIQNVSSLDYLNHQYGHKIYDEFINPVLFDQDYALRDGDAFFFINFRPDRAIELTLCLTWDKFNEFPTPVRPGHYLCMTPYVPDEVKLPILFDKEKIQGCMSEYLASLNKKQFKIAETEKYAHITYFFNGGRKEPYAGEQQVLIPSPREVATYDLKPEMSALPVTDRLVAALDSNQHDFYMVNYANADMVGHTGNYPAAVQAIEFIDQCVQRLIKSCSQSNITMIVTADHGNADQMAYPDGKPHTSHTGAKVPFCIFNPKLKGPVSLKTKQDAALMDVSPTILEIMGEPRPQIFEGQPIFS